MDWVDIGSIATGVGVLIGVWQFRQNTKLSRAHYEDSFDQQYRSLSMAIPVDALIGKPIELEKKDEVRELVYNYLDLCNEQVYLRSRKRITKLTWRDWSAGIRDHLNRPAFNEVWTEVKKEAPGTFSFLEKLENTGFNIDPASRAFK